MQRTDQNSPLGLEVQLHVTEAVCPALSEPGNQSVIEMHPFACVLGPSRFALLQRYNFLNEKSCQYLGRSASTSPVYDRFVCMLE